METLPIVKSVGDQVYLSCSSHVEDATAARWERLDGEMPANASTTHGVLKLPSVSRGDEGKYRCTVPKGGVDLVSVVELRVDDFVPVFQGNEALTLPALSDEKMKHFDVVLTINTTGESGIIFETVRRPALPGEDPASITRPPSVEHRARIDQGLVVYEYDVGHGKESIVSTNSIVPNEWNTVVLKNDENKAVLQLNSGPVEEKTHHTLVWEDGVNGPVFLGAHIDPVAYVREQEHFKGEQQQHLKGVISSITVSGESVPLGKSVRPAHMKSFDSCVHQSCLHSSQCRNSNTRKGYECVCPPEYTGEYCEKRSSKCKGEDCNSGICVEHDDMWQCVCPLATSGLRCEIKEESAGIDSVGFEQDTSFVAMPSPKNLDQLEISMVVKPQNIQDEHILLYVGEDYSPKSNKHLSISIVNGAILYTYKDGTDKEEIKSAPIEKGTEYVVILNRNNSATSLIINGELFTVKRKLQSFEPGTDLFVGGIPPGVDVPPEIPATSFRGCINEIRIDGTHLDFSNSSAFSSGDISDCAAVYHEETPTKELPTEPVPTSDVVPTEEAQTIYDTEKDGDAPEPVTPIVAAANVSEQPQQIRSTIVPGFTYEEPFHITPTTAAVELSTDNPCINGEEEECRLTACANHMCGPNGECVPLNVTSYECKCKLYYDGPRCDLFKPIERAASFDGDAFIEISADEFPHLTSEKEETVEMKFRTKKASGVLFWQGQQPGTSVVGEDYFSVGLVDGHLHFSYELGGGAAYMATEQRVDDDREHVLKLIRKGRRGILKLDNQPEQRGLSSGILAMLNADGNIFIGGVPDVYRATGGLHSENFVGCVADVSLNGEMLDLMGTAIDGKNLKPCDDWVITRRRFKIRRRLRSWTIL